MSSLSERSSLFYEKYSISPKFGFLSESVKLPDEFDIYQQIIDNLESADGEKFRKLVYALEDLRYPQSYFIELATKQNKHVQLTLYSIFTFIVQKFVRCMGKDDQLDVIPYEIGLVWYHCAAPFKLPTVTTYAAVVLNNWRLLNPEMEPSIDNFEVVHACSGTEDESWFYKVHLTIEQIGTKSYGPCLI